MIEYNTHKQIKMEKQRLLTWDQNYADEFDVFGFELVDDIAVQTVIKVLESIEDGDPVADEYYFGTNEAIDLCSGEVLDVLKDAGEPSEEEVASITKYLGDKNGQTFFDQICIRILDFNKGCDDEERILTDEERKLLEKYAW